MVLERKKTSWFEIDFCEFLLSNWQASDSSRHHLNCWHQIVIHKAGSMTTRTYMEIKWTTVTLNLISNPYIINHPHMEPQEGHTKVCAMNAYTSEWKVETSKMCERNHISPYPPELERITSPTGVMSGKTSRQICQEPGGEQKLIHHKTIPVFFNKPRPDMNLKLRGRTGRGRTGETIQVLSSCCDWRNNWMMKTSRKVQQQWKKMMNRWGVKSQQTHLPTTMMWVASRSTESNTEKPDENKRNEKLLEWRQSSWSEPDTTWDTDSSHAAKDNDVSRTWYQQWNADPLMQQSNVQTTGYLQPYLSTRPNSTDDWE